jgi:hypothetical protein
MKINTSKLPIGHFKYQEFPSLENAFNYCRERNAPVRIKVGSQRFKLYPSGTTLIDMSGSLEGDAVWSKVE